MHNACRWTPCYVGKGVWHLEHDVDRLRMLLWGILGDLREFGGNTGFASWQGDEVLILGRGKGRVGDVKVSEENGVGSG